MDINKVLYISQEITPYIKPNVRAELGRNLPQGIQEKGAEVRTFMPRYGCINERRNQLHEVIRLSGINIIIDDTNHPLLIKVATLQPARMQVYFIDSDDYFQRHGITDIETTLYPDDNDERSIFFVRGVMETVKKLRWFPSIIHCTGWVSALAPLYLKKVYGDDPSYKDVKIVFSIQSGEVLPKELDPRMVEKLVMDGIDRDHITSLAQAQTIDYNALMKLAIDHADAIVEASPDIDPELHDYAVASGKPLLMYPGDTDYIDSYHAFYTSL